MTPSTAQQGDQGRGRRSSNQYISRTQYSPIKQPSLGNLGLSIGGAAVDAYTTYDRVQTGRKTKD